MKRVVRASWLALLASTTLGANSTTLLAQVQLDKSERALRDAGPQRLVVQVYAGKPADLSEESKPTSSAQRAVTLRQLQKGVSVPLVETKISGVPTTARRLTVVAWVEPGDANLELDALNARPPVGKPMGTALLADENASVCVRLRSDVRHG